MEKNDLQIPQIYLADFFQNHGFTNNICRHATFKMVDKYALINNRTLMTPLQIFFEM